MLPKIPKAGIQTLVMLLGGVLLTQPFVCRAAGSAAEAPQPASAEKAFKMVYGKPFVIELIVCDSFSLAGRPKDSQFAAPLPPATPRQKVLSVKADKKFVETTDSSKLGRPILVGSFEEVEPHKLSERDNLVLTYKIELTPRKLELLPPGETPARQTLEKPEAFLQSDSTIDWQHPDFQRWMKSEKLARLPGESALYFGRRLFTLIRSKGQYKYNPTTWKASDFAGRCKARIVGDCGDFSILFAATCRANGIPCRMLSGRWAVNAKSKAGLQAGDVKTHVYVEFFDESIGWVPVDMSGAVERKGDNASSVFGTDPSTNFVTMHFDADLILPFEKRQSELQWLLLPVASSDTRGPLLSGTSHFMQVISAAQGK